MNFGIFGFPKVGKTTLFNLLTHKAASTDKFSTGRAAPNVGRARVADERVDRLAELYHPKKTTYASVQYVDVAGIRKGELNDSVDLADLRPVDALLHVVRAFEDPEIEHVPGALDPRRDIRSMEEELLLADLISVERRCERLDNDLKKRKDEHLARERDALAAAHKVLDGGHPLRSAEFDGDQQTVLRGFQFLSLKPILHVLNLGEDRPDDIVAHYGLEETAADPHAALSFVLGQIEMEISQLEADDARAFLDDLGLAETGLDRIIRTSYALLGLISFFTVGEDEVRAWTIRAGTDAVNAAGTIHSDIQRGFIRAEVMRYDDLMAHGSAKALKDLGLMRLEGKTYVVEDGEIAHFRFAV